MNDRRRFLESPEAVLACYGHRLRSILGTPLTDTWIAWDLEHNEWFNDEPVILRFGEHSMEASFNQLSQFAMTWDSIDVGSQPNWMGCFDGMPLQWRKNGHSALSRVIGQTLRDIAIVNYLFRTTLVDSRDNPGRIGECSESWILHALEFKFDTCCLVLYNALDENGLQNDPLVGREFTKLWLTAAEQIGERERE